MMNDWDFEEFRAKLKESVVMFSKDKSVTAVETYLEHNGQEFKVIIEKIKSEQRGSII